MLSINLKRSPVVGHEDVPAMSLLPHEEVVLIRATSLFNYLNTIEGYVVVPSIIACKDSKIIIDGHHRFWALQNMGLERIPVTYIEYGYEEIVPHISSDINKDQVLKAGTSGKLLPPKSTFHHVLDLYGDYQPIILLSTLCRVKL